MFDTDPTGPRKLLRHRGKTYSLHKENPAVGLGEEKPYKLP